MLRTRLPADRNANRCKRNIFMKTFCQYSARMILIGMACFLVTMVGCSRNQPEAAPLASEVADQKPAELAQSSSSPASQPVPKTAPTQSSTASSLQGTKTQSAVAPAEKPAPAPRPKKAAPDVILLKASLGTVRFQHTAHSETRKIACATCHHVSHPEKPGTAPQEACSTCHTLTAKPPMKTKLQAAFHNPTASAGACIDCHKVQNANGKAAPIKCLECHKKETA